MRRKSGYKWWRTVGPFTIGYKVAENSILRRFPSDQNAACEIRYSEDWKDVFISIFNVKNCLKLQYNGSSSSALNSGMESFFKYCGTFNGADEKIQNSGLIPCQGQFRHSRSKSSSKTQYLQACHSCGIANHSRSKCKFSNDMCYNCGLQGHIIPMCRKSKNPSLIPQFLRSFR